MKCLGNEVLGERSGELATQGINKLNDSIVVD